MARVHLPEQFDIASTANLAREFCAAGPTITIDGGDVTRTDCVALQLLLATAKWCVDRGGAVVWERVSTPLADAARTLGLTTLFDSIS